MKLIYFMPLLSTKGGQERTTIDKANYLVGKGHEVMFVTYEHEGAIAYQVNSMIKHVDLNCHFFSLYKYPVYQRLFRALKLKRLFRQRMKDVLKRFCPDLIVVGIPNTENYICDLIRVARDVPIVIESHLAYGHQVIKRGLTEQWLYYFYKPVKAIRKADLFISLTSGDARCWCGKQICQIMVIPNPLTFYPLSIPRTKKEEGRIISVGRFTSQKRFDRLIESFSLIAAQYPIWHIDVFGEGEEKVKLQRQINELGLSSRIRLLTPVQDIYSEYMRSQFLVMSSDFEGFGLVIIEAMSCGVPVVATNCPFGPSEIIDDGKDGILSNMDAKDLAQKMVWMISHDSERQEMGRLAYESVARYKKERVMKEWENAYSSVLQ